MNDLVLSIGIKTDEGGLKKLQSEIDKLDRKVQVTEAAMKNATGQSLKDLQSRYAKQTEHLEMMRKAQTQLNNALNIAKLNGQELSSQYIKLTRNSNSLLKSFEQMASAVRDNTSATKQLTAADLGGFLRGLDSSLKAVTKSINQQTEAFKLQNQQKEKNIQLSNQQAEAARRAAAVAPMAAPALPTPPVMPGGAEAKQGAGFLEKTGAIARQALISAPIYGGAYAATGQISQAISEYVELDSVLTRIAIVSEKTVGEARALREEFATAASSLGVSATEYAKGAELFFAQGGKAAEYAKELTEVSIQLANATDSTAESTSEYVTAIGNSFKLIEKGPASIQKIGDVLLYLGNISASSASEIGDAMRRSASSFQAAGIDMETASAMIATSLQVTRLAPERVGTAFKTIVETIQEVKEAGPKEMRAFTNKIQESIDMFPSLKGKLQLFDESGTEMVPTLDFLKQLQGAYQEIKDTDPMAIQAVAQAIGGKENANVLAALLQNKELFDRLYEGVTEDATGKAAEAQAKYMESLKANFEKLKNEFNEIIAELISPEVVKEVVDVLIKGMHAFRDLLGDSNQLIKLIGIGIGLILAKNALGAIFSGLSGVVGNFIGKVTGLNRLLGKGPEYDTSVFRNQTNQARLSTEQLTQAIIRQNAALKYNRALLNNQDLTPEERGAIEGEIRTGQERLDELRGQGGSRRTPEEQAARRRRLMDLRGVSRYGRVVAAGRSLMSGAGKIAAGAARLGGPITAVVGAGLSIADSIASGEELGPAVGKGAGAAIGGIVGGALGTLLGPVGTILGGAAGAYVGEWIGGKIANSLKDEKEELKKNYAEYEALYKKVREGKVLSAEEQKRYEELVEKLGDYTKALTENANARDAVIKKQKEQKTAEEEYVKALNKSAKDRTERSSLEKDIAEEKFLGSIDQTRLAEGKQKLIEQLGKSYLNKDITGSEYGVLLSQISDSTTNTIGKLQTIVKQNPKIFKGLEIQFNDLKTNAGVAFSKVESLGKTFLDNMDALSKDARITGIKTMLNSFGISDEIVNQSSENADAIAAMYIRLATISANAPQLLTNVNILRANQAAQIASDPKLVTETQALADAVAGAIGIDSSLLYKYRTTGEYSATEEEKAAQKKALQERQSRRSQILKRDVEKNILTQAGGNVSIKDNPALVQKKGQTFGEATLDLFKKQGYIVGTSGITGQKQKLYAKDIEDFLVSEAGKKYLSTGILTEVNKLNEEIKEASGYISRGQVSRGGMVSLMDLNSPEFQKYITTGLKVDSKIKPTKTTTGTGKDKKAPQPKTYQKVEVDYLTYDEVAEGEERLLDSINNEIKLIEKNNKIIKDKSAEIESLLMDRIEISSRITKKFTEARIKASKAKPLAGISETIPGSGILDEEELKTRKERLAKNQMYAQLALNEAIDKYNKFKGKDTDKKKLEEEIKRLKTATNNAENAFKEFVDSLLDYEQKADGASAAQDKFNSYIEEARQKIIDLRLEAYKTNIGEIMFPKSSLSRVKEFFESVKDLQDQFLDRTEKGLSLDKLSLKINQDLLKNKGNAQLVALQKKITDMKKNSNDYTEEEVKLLNAQYDVILKQIMLKKTEESANQDNVLMRDAEGNWIYAAKPKEQKESEEDAASKQIDLIEANENYYQQAKDAYIRALSEQTDISSKIDNAYNEIGDLQAKLGNAKSKEEKEKITSQITDIQTKTLPNYQKALERQKKIVGDLEVEFKRAALISNAISSGKTDLIPSLISGTKEDIGKIASESPEFIQTFEEIKKFLEPLNKPFEGTMLDQNKKIEESFDKLSKAVDKLAGDIITSSKRIENEALIASGVSAKERLEEYKKDPDLAKAEIARAEGVIKSLTDEESAIKAEIQKQPGKKATAGQTAQLKKIQQRKADAEDWLEKVRGTQENSAPPPPEKEVPASDNKNNTTDNKNNATTPEKEIPEWKKKLNYYGTKTAEAIEAGKAEIDRATGVYYKNKDIYDKAEKNSKEWLDAKEAMEGATEWAEQVRTAIGIKYFTPKTDSGKIDNGAQTETGTDTNDGVADVAGMNWQDRLKVFGDGTISGKNAAANEIDRASAVYLENEEEYKKTGSKTALAKMKGAHKWADQVRKAMKEDYSAGGSRPWNPSLPSSTGDPRTWDKLLREVYGDNSYGYAWWKWNITENGIYPTRGDLYGFETGGYTGDFAGGKLAVLHGKEIVLNKEDTKNLLGAVKINRSMFSPNPFAAQFSLNQKNSEGTGNLTINANFPNVSSADEIRKAFANMSNNASQYVYKMRTQQY